MDLSTPRNQSAPDGVCLDIGKSEVCAVRELIGTPVDPNSIFEHQRAHF
jgi:hypothetical protein